MDWEGNEKLHQVQHWGKDRTATLDWTFQNGEMILVSKSFSLLPILRTLNQILMKLVVLRRNVVTSTGAHLRDLTLGQHSYEKTSQR